MRSASRSTSPPVEAVTNRLTKQKLLTRQTILRARDQIRRQRLAAAARHRANATLERQLELPRKKATICGMELRFPARRALSRVRSRQTPVTSTSAVLLRVHR